jgi:ribosomal protein S18 acetylase RimI-like enzyme
LVVGRARPEDANMWAQLTYISDGRQVPQDMASDLREFEEAGRETAEGRFLAWLGGEVVGMFELRRLGRVVEMPRFWVTDGMAGEYRSEMLEKAVEQARSMGSVLTVERFPASYSSLFAGTGFQQNTRTRMIADLEGYVPREVALPEGVRLRRVFFDDEMAVAAMIYNNYMGTRDDEMVSADRAQAAAIIKAMFHNDYCFLDSNCSALAVDEQGTPVGDVLVGDQSRTEDDRLAWVLDISLAAKWRGKGLGKALLASAMNRTGELGYTRIGLMVTIGNEGAQGLYRSMGFRDYGDAMYEAVMNLA